MFKINEKLISSANYSTSEKIVGRWINNKPIYRKVLVVPKSQLSTNFNLAHGISNLDLMITARGMAKNSNDMNTMPWYASTNYFNFLNDIDTTYIHGALATNNYNKLVTMYFILEYTKTTD